MPFLHSQIWTQNAVMSNLCIQTHAGAKALPEMGHSHYLCFITVHHLETVYVLCGYRVLEEVNIRKQMPELPFMVH